MSKELARLNKSGLLLQHRVGNQLRFSANMDHPVYPELSALLRKTLGLADVLMGALAQATNRIAVAFVFGSVASSKETAQSDVDVIIIGELEFAEVIELLYDAQTTLQRDINPKIFSVQEWQTKIQTNSVFVLEVLSKPKIFLIGNQSELDKLVESGQDRSA